MGSNDSDIEILGRSSVGSGNVSSTAADSPTLDGRSTGQAGRFKVWSEERVPVVAKMLEEQLYHQMFWLVQENRDLLVELRENYQYEKEWADGVVERMRLNSMDVEGFLVLLKGIGGFVP